MVKKLALILVAVVLIGGGLTYYFSEQTLIKVDKPQPNEAIQSPYTISGQARGNWYFEATFPVKLLDENGQVVLQTFAQAKGDWMTTGFVPFESVLNFSVSKDQSGTLVLQKDNPSGLPQNDAKIQIPVILKATW